MNNKIRVPFMQRLRQDFLAGIAIIFPIGVTVYLFIVIFKTADGILGGPLNIYLYKHLGYKIHGIGIISGVIFILFVGIIANMLISRKFFPFLERLIVKIPLVRHIYAPTKQLSKFLFRNDKGSVFNKVVLVPYPFEGSYSIGFMTNDELALLDDKLGKKIVSVLISTPPSPFSGPLLFVPQEKVIVLDLSMEEAIKFIVSGGLAAPIRYLAHKRV